MSATHLTISPKEAYKELIHTAERGRVPYLTGSPGVGKSSIVRAIAKDFNLKLIDLRLSQCMPEDLQGFPMLVGNKATFVPFDTFPIESDPLPEGKAGWLLFLDELSSANKQVQAAAYKIILDRMVGSHYLHEKVIVMAAGNLATDKAVVVQMSTALQSRVIHFQLDVDPKGFVDHAIKTGFDKRVIAYLAYKPSSLMKFDPNHSDKTFPSPRTWEFVSDLVKGDDITAESVYRVAGAIGEGTATEFIGFAREFDRLPQLQDILDNPKGAPVPPELATRYATAVMLSEHINKDTAGRLIEYIGRFDIEMRIIFMRMALVANPKLPTQSIEVSNYMKSVARYLE